MSEVGFGQRELGVGGVWCIDTDLVDYLHGQSVVNLRGWVAIRGDDASAYGPFLGEPGSGGLNRVRREDVDAAFPHHTVLAFDDVVTVGALAAAGFSLTISLDGRSERLELPEIV